MARKLFAALAATAGLAFAASQAHAITFAGDYDVTYQSADPGLVVAIDPITPLANGLNFDLDFAGDWTLVPLFKLYTDETSVSADDTVAKPFAVDFSFTAPSGTAPGGVSGETDGFAAFFGAVQWGQLTFYDNQQTFAFGNGGLLQVTLFTFSPFALDPFGGAFNGGLGGLSEGDEHGVYVKAKFELLQESTAVPEPTAWALMIGGFGLAGAVFRRRRVMLA